jgi:hypothetical protein
MTTHADTYDAFAIALGTFAAQLSPALPLSRLGITFDPPDSGQWLEIGAFPNGTQNYGLADDAPALHQGFFRVGCCTRIGLGAVKVLNLAGAVAAAFPKGTVLGPMKVQQPPSLGGVITQPDRLIVPVTIRYRAFVG